MRFLLSLLNLHPRLIFSLFFSCSCFMLLHTSPLRLILLSSFSNIESLLLLSFFHSFLKLCFFIEWATPFVSRQISLKNLFTAAQVPFRKNTAMHRDKSMLLLLLLLFLMLLLKQLLVFFFNIVYCCCFCYCLFLFFLLVLYMLRHSC